MEAMVIEHCKMTWNVGIVAASAIIAVVAATVAFWILFRLLALYPHYEILRIAGAVVAAVAVNGMHYTGNETALLYLLLLYRFRTSIGPRHLFMTRFIFTHHDFTTAVMAL
jgi:NO-binding membrane sensor protein with MHYT domain